MGGRRRVLIVDDYAPFATSLRLALAERYEVHVAVSATEAGARLAATSEAWDAVVCDLHLEGSSGLRLQQGAPVPLRDRFIFMTGGGTSEGDRAFLVDSGDRHLIKPFAIDSLEEKLDALWSRG